MSEDTHHQPSETDETAPPAPDPSAEVEDELSPIDTMELLSRAGRHHLESGSVGTQEPAAATTAAEPADRSEAELPLETEADGAPETEPETETPETAEEIEAFEQVVAEAVAEEEPEEFDQLLEEYLDRIHDFASGDIIDAEIVDVKRDYVLVDVGDKAEGVIDVNEFVDAQGDIHVSVGDKIPVQILGREPETGQVRVSYGRALAELAWERVEEAHRRQTPVTGRVSRTVRSGVLVDVGLPAFMPASQIDTSRVENLEDWVDREVAAYVIDLDRSRERVVVSRRKLVQEDEERKRQRILESLEPGQTRVVRIKKILDFGAFADLGGIDGLIPRVEVSWERGSHPNQYLREGRDLKVRVVNVDRDKGRITLSRKRVRPDPWEKIDEKYPPETVVKGKVVGLANFGAFIGLEEGVRGMIHASDLSWGGGRKKVTDFLRVGDSVKAVVLEADKEQRRLSLGLKQITMDPWVEVEEKFPPGTVVKGAVTAVTNYGAFVRLTEHVEGLVHVSDMSWDKKVKNPSQYVQVGQEVEAVVIKTERDRRRINLGLKQMTKSPFERFVDENREGSVVTGKVTRLADFGAFVQLAPDVEGLIHISQLDDQRVEKTEEAVKPGETVEAKVVKIDKKNCKIGLSRRAFIKEQTRRETAAYMSRSDSGGMKMGELLQGLNIQPVDAEDSSESS